MIENFKVEKRKLSSKDRGSYLNFTTQAEADKFTEEFIQVMNGGVIGDKLLALSGIKNASIIGELINQGNTLTFEIKKRTLIKPIAPSTQNKGTGTMDEATCITQTCTDWFYAGGDFIATTCNYELEPCVGFNGGVPGGGANSGTVSGGGGSVNTGGTFRNGSGIAIFHTKFPRYTAATDHEVQVACFKNNVTGVTSSLTGFIAGLNYEQKNYVVTSIVNGIAMIQISYNVTHTSLVEGDIKSITRNGVVFEVSVNMKTGQGTFLH